MYGAGWTFNALFFLRPWFKWSVAGSIIVHRSMDVPFYHRRFIIGMAGNCGNFRVSLALQLFSGNLTLGIFRPNILCPVWFWYAKWCNNPPPGMDSRFPQSTVPIHSLVYRLPHFRKNKATKSGQAACDPRRCLGSFPLGDIHTALYHCCLESWSQHWEGSYQRSAPSTGTGGFTLH